MAVCVSAERCPSTRRGKWVSIILPLPQARGRPTIIDLKNNLANGIRKASDFLMALQLTGAFKRTALPNLQVRLPALVNWRRPDRYRYGD
jgi:hypothetical protein